MNLEYALLSVPPGHWRVQQVYPYDWYDGPREGACALMVPPVEFYFELFDERFNPHDLDDRLYRLSELPAGSVAALQAVHDAGIPLEPSLRDAADRRIQAIRASKRPTDLVVYSRDFEQFLGCWLLPRTAKEPTVNWFEHLGLPQMDSREEEEV